MAKRTKRIQDRWETGICNRSSNSDWWGLVINAVDKKKFQPGDKVRVTVTLLKREERGK